MDGDERTGTRLPHVRIPPPGPRTREWARRLREVESRNVTWLGPDFPVFWEEARGANVLDPDGNVYLDLSAAFGVAVAGHAHPRITDAIREQSGRLVHGMGDVHPPVKKVEFLERLSGLAPWSNPRSVLASSGSEAVEVALKTAELATGRSGVVAFEGGYHGLTLGALATTARPDFRSPFRSRVYRGVAFAPYPDADGDEEGLARSLQEVERHLDEGARGTEVGAVIVEPVQGRGGVRVPPTGFLPALATMCRSHGALLVVDEIFTGVGRTGTFLALDHEGVAPDLVCLGKALGGGLPLSACMGPREVMDAWPPSSGEALHTSTFLGHPLACAAGLALLEVLEEEGLPGRAARVGAEFLRGLDEALEDVEGCRVRGRGLLLGVELPRGPAPEPDGPVDGRGIGPQVAAEALRRGLIVLPAGDRGEVVQLSPPLTISDEQVEHAVGALAEVVTACAVSLSR